MASIILKTLKPENIKEGVTILKTTGTFQAGPGIVNEDITVNSSTVEQQFQAGPGYTGLGTVTVNPYSLDSKTVNSSTSSQTVNSSADGMSTVTVNPYSLDSKTVNSSTSSQTVNSSADGLSSVTVNPYTLDSKTVDPSTSAFTVNSSADGLSSVTLNAVTSSIDSNISAGNIKQGVTILGVTGTLSSDSDWILDAKNGATTLDTDTEGLANTNYGMYQLFQGTALTSVTLRNTTIGVNGGDHALYYAFYNVNGITSVSFPELVKIDYASNAMERCFEASMTSNCTVSFPKLEEVRGYYAMSCAFNRHVSGALSFPELTVIQGNHVMGNFCQTSNVTTVSFPKLEEISGNNAFGGAFADCASIVSISMPNVKYKKGDDSVFNEVITRSSSPTLEATPEVFKSNNSSGEKFSSYHSTDFSDITLRIPTGYTYSDGWNNSGTTYICFNYLSSNAPDSTILDILQKLGNVSDYDQVSYTVVFPTRSVNDNINYDYTNAYDKLVNAGWTINNLTINAPQLIEITSGSRLNLKNDDTITFNAMYGWTASVNDPSIGLSAYSGNAGDNQSVTVTMDPDWEGNATVTFSCSNGTVTQTKTVSVFYSNAAYTRLQYADIGGNQGQNCDTGVILNSSSKIQLDFMSLNYAGGAIISTDSRDTYSNEWRIFGYGGSMYFDLGGGGSNTRMYCSGWCQNNVRHNYEFGKYYITNLDTSQTYSGSSSNTFTSTSPDTMKIGGEADTARIYDLRFYVDGTNLSHHFVPAKDANDVVGFWDMVNDTFITPNTGTITGGPVYTDTYTRLQWAAIGNSDSQYCNTGVILNSSSKMQLSFMPKGYGGSTVTTSGLDGYATEWRTFGHNGGMYFDLAGGGSSSRLIASGWYTVDASCNYEFGKYYIKNLDNQTQVTGSSSNQFISTGTDTMKIGIGTNGNYIFELKFYVDGTNLSHDFVPAMDNNNVVGYYDLINDRFITPNTGTITGGPVYS